MKIKEFSITRYGPLKNITPFRLTDFNLFWGKNEDGKTLTIDALVKLLLGRNVRDFEHIDRVEESPEGYVIIEDDKNKEIKLPEKGNLTKVVGLTPSECRNIFIIRNSDLSIARESEFYTNVTDRLTGLRTEEISSVKKKLQELGQLTRADSSADLSDSKDFGKIKSRVNISRTLIKEIDGLRERIKKEKFDELEEESARQREEIDRIIQKMEDLEDARKREKYEKGKEALDKLKEALERLKELKIYNEDEEKSWEDSERKLQEYVGEKKGLLDELKKEKQMFDKVTKNLEEKEQDFQIMEQRRKVIDEMEREIREFIDLGSKLVEKGKGKAKVEKRAEEVEQMFQTLKWRKREIEDQIRPYMKNYVERRAAIKSQEPKNKFFTLPLVACGVLLGISLVGIIIRPLILFYLLFSLFFVSSFIFGLFKFRFIRGKGELAKMFEEIRINLSKFGLGEDDFEGLSSNLQEFEEEYSQKEEERERAIKDKTALENDFNFADNRHRESGNRIKEAAAKLGWNGQQNVEEHLPSIEEFREDYSKEKKELEDARVRNKSLEDKIKELEDIQIPRIKRMIEETEEGINKIKRKSREESIQEYVNKLKLKHECKKSLGEQKSILESLFGAQDKTLEKNISYWNGEIKDLEDYRHKAINIEYDEKTVSKLKEDEKLCEGELDKIKEKMNRFQKGLEGIEREANKILQLEADYWHCKTSVDLDAIKNKIEEFINENESNKDNVLEVMKIFEEIETVEKEKVSELFGKDSSIPNYFNEITDGLYEEVLFNQKVGEIKVKRKDGVVLEAGKLSGGAYDQLYLSIRLALGEKLLKGKKGFFIMDDPFVKADPDRLQRQIETLKKISELGWQIIYFSAKGEIKDVLNDYIDCGAVNYIEVQGIFS